MKSSRNSWWIRSAKLSIPSKMHHLPVSAQCFAKSTTMHCMTAGTKPRTWCWCPICKQLWTIRMLAPKWDFKIKIWKLLIWNVKVLYNRTICQLGLCAFRHGFVREAHQNLSEIQNTQRSKDLLAQGIPPRQSEKSPEQVMLRFFNNQP